MGAVEQQILIWAITYTLAGITGYLAAKLSSHKKDSQDYHDNMREGMGVLLRQELIDYHRLYVEEHRTATVSDAEQLTSIYAAYHNLGFNGTGTKLYQETFSKMEIRED